MKKLIDIKRQLMLAANYVSTGQSTVGVRQILVARDWIAERGNAATECSVKVIEGKPVEILTEGKLAMMRKQFPELVRRASIVLEDEA